MDPIEELLELVNSPPKNRKEYLRLVTEVEAVIEDRTRKLVEMNSSPELQ